MPISTSGLKPFEPGQSGNPDGKPKGSRNKFSETFVKAFADDFETHGVAVIQEVRDRDPVAYLRISASLMLKIIEVNNPFENLTDEQLVARLRIVDAALIAAGVLANQDNAGETAKPKQTPDVPSVH